MKSVAEKFLSAEERGRIEEAVGEAEKKTAGEIVPMVVPASYHYPLADILGGVFLALPVSILLTYLLGGMLWAGSSNMWVFMGVFCVVFIVFHQVVQRVLPLKRIFVSKREIDEEVEEAAITAFFTRGLYRTRDETGILIFISVFERKVWVLADRGINAKVSPGRWDTVVARIVDGIKGGRQAEAICEAVKEVGGELAEHFPVKDDDENELDNLIVQ
ncbi:MAG: TPM domain-containing protein [Deltaproteobacteria bacterium]|jgi:putative membrane protein|nr:TPM domain-containing protein [Deltaproteobacteria bacterium]